ncbi:MAG: hypothetical protein K2Y37_18415, partial [Pirellulales bacterium]|nr:hypothetical protein [Pirellulales bacterium]
MRFGAIEIIVLFVVIFILAGVFHRRSAPGHRTAGRMFLLGCSTVLFGALAVGLLLAVIVGFRVHQVV